jgi:hypothetical protein
MLINTSPVSEVKVLVAKEVAIHGLNKGNRQSPLGPLTLPRTLATIIVA